MKDKRFIWILLGILVLLSIPLIAMQFTDAVTWSPFDFMVMGGLLLAAGFSCELVLRNIKKANLRVILCLGIVAILLLIWAELAVGVLGTPLAGS